MNHCLNQKKKTRRKEDGYQCFSVPEKEDRKEMDEDDKNVDPSRGEGDLPMLLVGNIPLPPPKIDKEAMETKDADIVY